MKFGINNPSFLQSAGNAGGVIDERFYIKALEDNTEVEFLYPEQTLMSTDGVEYVRATNTTLNTGDKLYMYTDETIHYPEGIENYNLISVSKGFAAGGLVPLSTFDDGYGELYESRFILQESNIIDASKVIVLADGSCSSLFYGCTSLVNAPELPAEILKDYCYSSMFSGCTSLVNAPELPATTLAVGCYSSMFYGCTSLVNAPELPATTLVDGNWDFSDPVGCYSSMFYGCTSLVNAPELPAEILKDYCYYSMFYGCTSLVNAPELPATTLAVGCYSSMFSECTSLVNAPELPATTLAESAPFNLGCCKYMFSDCTSLVNAPELPAEILKDYCYSGMFHGCSNLRNVECLAVDISAEGCLEDWLYGVSETGTFTKAAGAEWPTGASGIPTGWTVIEQ